MNIAILYICTGHYDIFWDGFYTSCEENFYPEHKKEYFVFSDSPKMHALASDKIHVLWQNSAGWPYNTLMRYQWFCTVQDKLKGFDAIYFCNANMRFLMPISDEHIPYPSKEAPLVLAVHTQNYEDTLGTHFFPERNPASAAYIKEGTPIRAYAGGFWGGTAEAVLSMCKTLRDRVNDDLSRGIIAVWHDQSHLEKYATENPHLIIAKGIISSEEFADAKICRAMFLNKEHFGGNDVLRGASKKTRLVNKTKKALRKVARTLGITKLVKKLRKKK